MADGEKTTVSVTDDTHTVLYHLKKKGESYDEAIRRVIEKAENQDFSELLKEAEKRL